MSVNDYVKSILKSLQQTYERERIEYAGVEHLELWLARQYNACQELIDYNGNRMLYLLWRHLVERTCDLVRNQESETGDEEIILFRSLVWRYVDVFVMVELENTRRSQRKDLNASQNFKLWFIISFTSVLTRLWSEVIAVSSNFASILDLWALWRLKRKVHEYSRRRKST